MTDLPNNWWNGRIRRGSSTFRLLQRIGAGDDDPNRLQRLFGSRTVRNASSSGMIAVGRTAKMTLYGRILLTASGMGVPLLGLLILSYAYESRRVGAYIKSLYEIEMTYDIQVTRRAFDESFRRLRCAGMVYKDSIPWHWCTNDAMLQGVNGVLSGIHESMMCHERGRAW